MGCVLSSSEQKESLQRSKDIDSRLAYEHERRSKEIKLLLLGEPANLSTIQQDGCQLIWYTAGNVACIVQSCLKFITVHLCTIQHNVFLKVMHYTHTHTYTCTYIHTYMSLPVVEQANIGIIFHCQVPPNYSYYLWLCLLSLASVKGNCSIAPSPCSGS